MANGSPVTVTGEEAEKLRASDGFRPKNRSGERPPDYSRLRSRQRASECEPPSGTTTASEHILRTVRTSSAIYNDVHRRSDRRWHGHAAQVPRAHRRPWLTYLDVSPERRTSDGCKAMLALAVLQGGQIVEKKNPAFEEMIRMRVVFSVPGMDAVSVPRSRVQDCGRSAAAHGPLLPVRATATAAGCGAHPRGANSQDRRQEHGGLRLVRRVAGGVGIRGRGLQSSLRGPGPPDRCRRRRH